MCVLAHARSDFIDSFETLAKSFAIQFELGTSAADSNFLFVKFGFFSQKIAGSEHFVILFKKAFFRFSDCLSLLYEILLKSIFSR